MSEVFQNLLNGFVVSGIVNCKENSFSLDGYDFHVQEYSLNGRGGEDKTYTDQTLRRVLPRGLCIIKVDGVIVHIVTGIVKFGYDGDYEQNISREIVTKQLAEKENGQCGHLSAFIFCGQKYLVFGSKLVHLIARVSHLQQDIDSHITPRYTVAVNIANLFIEKHLHTIDAVVTFCNLHKVTLCCEAIFPDDQHIVNYNGDKSLRFFAITCPIETDESLTWCNPLEARQYFEEIGLNVITKISAATSTEWDHCAEDFRNATNSEGAVVYCLDCDGKVIFIYKDKNHQYVFWRAVREQLRNRASQDNFLKRLNNPQFKNLVDREAQIRNAVHFRAFFFRLPEEERKQLFTKWNDYYTIFDQLSLEDREMLLQPTIQPVIQSDISSDDNLDVVLLIGPPGVGKSTLAAMLPGIHLEQDMFAGSSNPKNEYHSAIAKHASDPHCKCLVLAKANHTVIMRNEAQDILNKSGRMYRVYFVVFEHRPVDFYVERVTKRGKAHRTLHPSETTGGIIFRFLKEAKANPLTSAEESVAIYINPDLPKEENLRQVVEFLKSKGMASIDLNDEVIDTALKNVTAYEESNLLYAETNSEKIIVKSKPSKSSKSPKPLYDALVFQPDIVKEIVEMKEISLTDKKIKEDFHTTLTFYSKDKPVRTDLNFGEEIPVNIIGVASDEKATTLVLDKSELLMELQPHAEYPHITFALADGIKPFYSNELVKRCITDGTIILFDEPISLIGTITRF